MRSSFVKSITHCRRKGMIILAAFAMCLITLNVLDVPYYIQNTLWKRDTYIVRIQTPLCKLPRSRLPDIFAKSKLILDDLQGYAKSLRSNLSSTDLIKNISEDTKSADWRPNTTNVRIFNSTTSMTTFTTSAPSTISNGNYTKPDEPYDVLQILQKYALSLANTTYSNLFRIVSNSLTSEWTHNTSNAKNFKRNFEKDDCNNCVYDRLMLSKENTYMGMKIHLVHRSNHSTRITKRDFGFLPKKNALPPPPYKTCSVIGSSGLLLGSRCGRTIDASDFVFRFNLATTFGYEDDVGNKTNITTMNPSILRKSYSFLRNTKYRSRFRQMAREQKGFIWTPMYGFAKNGLGMVERMKSILKPVKDVQLIVADPRNFNTVFSLWSKYGLHKRTSTGFYFINIALALCDNVQAFGFWPFNVSADGRPIANHYYDGVKFSKFHDMSYEFKLILAMHRHGLLRLRTDQCESQLIPNATVD